MLPEEFQTCLVYSKHEDKTAGQTTPWNMVQPLCEFNTNLPRFAPELFQIYRKARIMRIDVVASITNTSTTEPLITTCACLPFVDASVSTLSPITLADWPKATIIQTGVANGISVKVLRKSYSVASELGEQNVGRTFFQDYSEAITSGVLGDLPAIYVGTVASKPGATWTALFQYEFRMHIRFSGLNYPSIGLKKPNSFLKLEETEDEDEISEKHSRVATTSKPKRRDRLAR